MTLIAVLFITPFASLYLMADSDGPIASLDSYEEEHTTADGWVKVDDDTWTYEIEVDDIDDLDWYAWESGVPVNYVADHNSANEAAVENGEVEINNTSSYSVKFNANGGSGTMSNQSGFTYGTAQALDANTFTAPSGKVFSGWSLSQKRANKNQVDYLDEDDMETGIMDDNGLVNLYAAWKRTPVVDPSSEEESESYVSEDSGWVKVDDDTWTYTFTVEDTSLDWTAWEESVPDNYSTTLDNNDEPEMIAITNSSATIDNTSNYSVKFDANGGSGTMADQTGFVYGTAQNLNENGYTAPEGKRFKGWSTTKARADAGTVDYADEAALQNGVMDSNGFVTLYASWEDLPIPLPTGVEGTKTVLGAVAAMLAVILLLLCRGISRRKRCA